MTYSDNSDVRKEAGFENNPNILDSDIQGYREQSFGIVQSYIAAIYSIKNLLPAGPLFIGSQAEGLLKRAETLFAAGYLLMKDYGLQGLGTDKDGQRKIQEAEKLLQRLIDGKNPLRLIDNQGNEFGRIAQASGGRSLKGTGIVEGGNEFSTAKVF